jgi:hypothetical protein
MDDTIRNARHREMLIDGEKLARKTTGDVVKVRRSIVF